MQDFESDYIKYNVREDVLNARDVMAMVPALKRWPRLVNAAIKLLAIDKINAIHARHCKHPGAQFCHDVIGELDIHYRIDNAEILDNLPEGPFITVSNHAYGAMDGIMLIDIIGMKRPDFKVMVNMMLNHISAMRPNFIAVDAMASGNPEKRAVSMHGIKEAISTVREGHPLGFFPAGAVSKLNGRLQLDDREWQPNIGRLIKQLKVPVIPIFFHGGNSAWFNILGRISWQLRTLRLPAEVFNKNHSTVHISIGTPIDVEEQQMHASSPEELCAFLKERTFSMRKWR